jgi:hypothetical protein
LLLQNFIVFYQYLIAGLGSASTKMNAKHKAAENLIDQICEAGESNFGLKDYTNSDVLQFYE